MSKKPTVFNEQDSGGGPDFRNRAKVAVGTHSLFPSPAVPLIPPSNPVFKPPPSRRRRLRRVEIEAEDDHCRCWISEALYEQRFDVIHPPTSAPSASNQLTRLRLAAPLYRRFGTFLSFFSSSSRRTKISFVLLIR